MKTVRAIDDLQRWYLISISVSTAKTFTQSKQRQPFLGYIDRIQTRVVYVTHKIQQSD